MEEQQNMSAEQFKTNHLLNRISEITAEYENKMANGTVQLQMLVQERDEARATAQALQARNDQLEAELADLKKDEVKEEAAHTE